MHSEKYRKFLEQQAEKNPVKIEGSRGTERFKISWQDNREKPAMNTSSDILDSIYLGKNMQESVVVERRVASLLQDRLRGLEEENIRIHRRVRLMKLAIGALLVVVAVVSLALLTVFYPRVQIMLWGVLMY